MLASTEDAWGEIFQQSGSRYQAPNWCFIAAQPVPAAARANR